MWRTVLCWTSVIIFFMLPISVFILQIYAASHPSWITAEAQHRFIEPHIAYLQNLQRDVTYIVIGLAGLKTLEVIRNGRNGKQDRKKTDENGSLQNRG